jgi:glycosyltransferase involved in cell wall biosynthesis
VARVLWIGDGGCHTGFGRVTHSIGERLVEMGHDVHVLATNFRGDHYDTTLKLYVPTLNVASDLFGRSRVIELLAKLDPDVVVMLNDANIILQMLFENPYDTEKYLLQYRPLITYIPVDGYERPPAWGEILTQVSNVVAMSRFGQAAFPGSKLVYHGVDSDLFWPVSAKRPITFTSGKVAKSKADAKEALGYSRDDFLILRIDKNSGRKDWPALWSALTPVMRRHKDIRVHFHTQVSEGNSGIMMNPMLSRTPDIKDRFHFPDMTNSFIGWSQQDLNGLYNAADLFVSTSRGEGFGLTLAEAAATACPIIAQNVSAIPEVVGPGGILLEPQRPITVPSGQDLWLANIEAFTEAIEHLYQSRGARRELGKAGRDHVEKSFSWDFAAARFSEYIEAMASVTGTAEANNAD